MTFNCVGISDDGNPIDGFANARFSANGKTNIHTGFMEIFGQKRLEIRH